MTSKHANLAVLISFLSLETISLSVFIVFGLLQNGVPSPQTLFRADVLENISDFSLQFIAWTTLPAGVHAFVFAAVVARVRWWRQPLKLASFSFLLSCALFGLFLAFVRPPWPGIPLRVFLVTGSVAPVGAAWIVYRCFLPAARREGDLPA